MNKITCSLTILLLFSFSITAQSTATYDINFTSTWNSADHGSLPSNAHWSNLVGANHNSNVTFLEMGGTATQGIENVAETGSNSVFNSEVQIAINADNAEQWLEQSFSPFAAISSATLTDVIISEDYTLLTLVSMIAPSPDWIIAVNSLDLWDSSENKWKESFSIDLFPYDAGTENGFGYSGSNPATNPRGVITNIAGASGYPFGPEKIGILTVTLKSTTLGTTNFENNKVIMMYPNPNSTGSITITNSNTLSEVIIYDILGKNVKQHIFSNAQNTTIINVSDLNNGIYIVKFMNKSGSIETKKLIVK